MEKEAQVDSIATIPIKADYAPSEGYSSEPPPAYHRHPSAAVQVAKIIAVTVVLVSVILGGFILAGAYVQANASCRQLEQELELLAEAADRLDGSGPLQPEALVRDEPIRDQSTTNEIVQKPAVAKKPDEPKETESASSESDDDDDSSDDHTSFHIKLPLQLDLDDLAGSIIDRNQRSRMNCVIEKKKAEEMVDHEPKSIRLPFGLNLTTEGGYEHITGERMVILCESGSMQKHSPAPAPHQQRDGVPAQAQSDEDDETIMVQPIVIPLGPINPYQQTHMPQQQMRPMMQPMMQAQYIPMSMPHPMETLRPPMPGPIMNHIQQQQQPSAPQQQQQPQQQTFPLPNPFIQHLAQQIIAQRLRAEAQRAQEEARNDAIQSNNEVVERGGGAQMVMAQRIPIPEEILRQINRLPNQEVIVQVQEQESDEGEQDGERAQPEMRVVQHARQSAHDVNGRQTYARALPVQIPMRMVEAHEQAGEQVGEQQQQEQADEQQQQPEAAASETYEERRPHYVQPRSVRSARSVDALLKNEKRVKRCACDCAC